MKYVVELTEEQARVAQKCFEFYMRFMMGQDYNVSEEVAMTGVDFGPGPEHDRIFNAYIQRRDHLREIMKCYFRIGFGMHGVPKEKTEDGMIAECMWDAMRFARGQSRWDAPFQIGSEPVPKIIKVEESDGKPKKNRADA